MMSLLIGTKIKPFRVDAFHNNAFVELNEASLKGKWSIIIFYPMNFNSESNTDLIDLAQQYKNFQKLDAEIYTVSRDTHFSHAAWHELSEYIGKIKFPMIGDPLGTFSENFDVVLENEFYLLCGTFIIDPEGTIKSIEINDFGVPRSAAYTLKKLRVIQHSLKNRDNYCPANWDLEEEAIRTPLDLEGKI